MKAFLMYRDHDFDLHRDLPVNAGELIQDLELSTLFKAMSLDDKFLFEVATQAVLSGLSSPDNIIYRQNILKDCIGNSAFIRDIYALAVEAIEKRKKVYFFFGKPSLYGLIEVLKMYVGILKKMRSIVDKNADKLVSEGFTTLFAMLKRELSDEYFAIIQNHLAELEFDDGVLISAELGEGNKGANYTLRKLPDKERNWFKRIFGPKRPAYTFSISDRDESGARALSQLKDRGLDLVVNALAQSTDHMQSFFNMLRTELAFYIGCLNLYGELAQKGESVSYPLPVAPGEDRLSFYGLYDVCLAISMDRKIVGNDVNADGKDLVVITGANQGGKSTFLRSIGLAQLMMQCGMFVPAESFCSNVCASLFTHFKREEDAAMNSGKLDEELSRMSDIIDNLKSDSMMLFNESFAATNEREGSEIARQIICSLLEKRIKILFVTHLYQFAHAFYDNKMEYALFLRAERHADGGRTFKIIEGEPLQTSYGEDLYNTIFGRDN